MEFLKWFLGCPYFIVAALFTLFYSVRCVHIFQGEAMVTATSQLKFWDKWIHKIWHNFLGSLLGWIILYYLLHKYLMNHYNYKVELTNVDLFLVFFAFIGVTGFIPTALIGIAQSLSSLFEKALDYATKK